MKFRHSQKVTIEMGPLTLAAIGNLTSAIDTLSANLPVDSDDASDAALIDAQTQRIVDLTPAVPVPADPANPIDPAPAAIPAGLTASVPGALPGQS